MPRPISVQVIPSNIQHNLGVLKKHANPAKIFAVLKANAYGHGIKNIYSGLFSADGIAVLDLEEAILLRELGWKKPILLLEGFFNYGDINIIINYNLITVIHSIEQIRILDVFYKQNNNIHKHNNNIHIYLKMNTGMNRLGICNHVYLNIYNELKAKPWLASLTHMSHYANSDIQSSIGIDEQLTIFNQITSNLPEAKSTSNSGAILWHKNAHFDWVRAGIALYGASPSGVYNDIKHIGLKPCMNFNSEIIGIQNVKQGQAVGYGSRFVALHNMRIGVVACGYADGYSRHAKDGTPIIVNNQLTSMVGKVSMDMLTVDITNIEAHIGSSVQMWGEQLHIDEIAQNSSTIGYELMCAIAPRVPKIVI